MFSSRVPPSLAPNALSIALDRLRARGRSALDLTVTNPTAVGIEYPEGVLDGLSAAGARSYHPDPAGILAVREALADVIGDLGAGRPSADDLFLTASTSEAYAVLFKLLCDPGDRVLIPHPSYPLFEHLAALENVVVSPYALAPHWDWSVDVEALEAAWTPRAKAVVVVSPNNPTGTTVRDEDRRRLLGWCAARRVALIVDEVFRWYPLSSGHTGARVSPFLGADDVPGVVFALDGLSKSCGLPQVKLAWIQMAGESAVKDEARRRLDLILDTYLSVGTPVQVAFSSLWAHAGGVRDAIRSRLEENLAQARELLPPETGCSLVTPAGGWSLAMRVPAVAPEERLVLDLLEQDGVLVHPGYFFDFPAEAYLVLSLLPRRGEFADGVSRIVRRCRIA